MVLISNRVFIVFGLLLCFAIAFVYVNYFAGQSATPAPISTPTPAPTPSDENWCWEKYLHRRFVETINTVDDNTGVKEKLSIAEARAMGLVKNGDNIYMENIKEAGILCGSYLYYGVREAYLFCDNNLLSFKAQKGGKVNKHIRICLKSGDKCNGILLKNK